MDRAAGGARINADRVHHCGQTKAPMLTGRYQQFRHGRHHGDGPMSAGTDRRTAGVVGWGIADYNGLIGKNRVTVRAPSAMADRPFS